MYITPLPCHLCVIFMTHFVYKGHTHNLSICHNFHCHINERKTPTTCLTNHKSSISHHIMPLVIKSLGGGDTHAHIHTDIADKSNFKKPVVRRLNKREIPKTCLTNHKGSISHLIIPLVINSLGGRHTYTHVCMLTLQTQAISRNQLHAGLWLMHNWFLEIAFVHNMSMRVCVCVCPPLRL